MEVVFDFVVMVWSFHFGVGDPAPAWIAVIGVMTEPAKGSTYLFWSGRWPIWVCATRR
jgi:hypothetical protein